MYNLQKVTNMSYNIAKYVITWRFNGLRDCETMADLSKTVFVQSTNDAFKRTNTHIYIHAQMHTHIHTNTLTNPIGENAMPCILLKNQAIG